MSDERRRAYRRLQHGVQSANVLLGLGRDSIRSIASAAANGRRYLLALPGRRAYTIGFQPVRRGLAFPPQHGESLYRPAARLRPRPEAPGLWQASLPLQPVSARPNGSGRHLWRTFSASLLLFAPGPVIYFPASSAAASSRPCTSRPPRSPPSLPLDLRVEPRRHLFLALWGVIGGGWLWAADGAAAC